jgi:periplasmic protein CpxP/Spy
MNKNVLTNIGILVLGIVLGFGGTIAVHRYIRHHMTPDKRAAWIVKRLKKELSLTDDQVTKLNGIKDKLLAKRAEMRGSRKEMHDQFISLLVADSFDAKAANVLMEGHGKKFKETMKPFMLAELKEFHDLLTPEQRQTFGEKARKFFERHHADEHD